jgi:hypothetical protein
VDDILDPFTLLVGEGLINRGVQPGVVHRIRNRGEAVNASNRTGALCQQHKPNAQIVSGAHFEDVFFTNPADVAVCTVRYIVVHHRVDVARRVSYGHPARS